MPTQKLCDDILTKCEANASIILAPTDDVLIGIRPQQIAQQARVRYVSRPHNTLNLLHVLQLRGEAAMHAEDLLVDDRGNGQAVEAISERLPQFDVVTSLALIIKAVYSVDTGAFVISTQNEEVLRIFDLVGQQQADSLQGLLAAINVVAHEEVVRRGREAPVLEEPQQVVVLPVNVSADLGREGECVWRKG